MCAALEDYSDSDHVPVAILQSATLAAAQGSKAPNYLSVLILPSHYLKIARDMYDNDKRDVCLEFAKKAFEMRDRLTEDAQVEALRLWGLAAIRISDDKSYRNAAEELSKLTSKSAKRIGHFLEGFRLRLRGRLDDAEQHFLSAWNLSRTNQSINRELASLYCKQKRYSDAERHARSAYTSQPVNPYILDIMAETLLGKLETGLDVDRAELGRVLVQ
jgi:tetratricopeptide (TPR) repeat protein